LYYNSKLYKKSLKIPQGSSESVNRRRTDNIMAKRKRTNNDLQNITHKMKDRVTGTPLKNGAQLRCSGRVGSSCFTSDTRGVNLVKQMCPSVIRHRLSSSMNK
jgi:hypothetical protein